MSMLCVCVYVYSHICKPAACLHAHAPTHAHAQTTEFVCEGEMMRALRHPALCVWYI